MLRQSDPSGTMMAVFTYIECCPVVLEWWRTTRCGYCVEVILSIVLRCWNSSFPASTTIAKSKSQLYVQTVVKLYASTEASLTKCNTDDEEDINYRRKSQNIGISTGTQFIPAHLSMKERTERGGERVLV